MAIGEGQSVGCPPLYGGPHYGFFAARQEFVRRMPGRIVGETVDLDGAARVRPHSPDARAAHPPREGDLEHHDEPDVARARGARDPRVARPAGAARGGRDVRRARRVRAGANHRSRSRSSGRRSRRSRSARRARRASRPSRARPRRPPRLRARPRLRGHGRRAARRLTEKRTPDDVDRLARRSRRSLDERAGRAWPDARSSSSAPAPAAAPGARRDYGLPMPELPPSFAARVRRGFRSSPSPRSSATSRRSPTARSASTPASTRSAPAR